MSATLRYRPPVPRTSTASPLVRTLKSPEIRATPFLKWVGGKTRLLAELQRHLPARTKVKRYHEPFVGGGALFFAALPKRASLSDLNGELVHCYREVQGNVAGVLDALARHVYERSHFEMVRALDPLSLDPSRRAARFIYLNKTCFNGLWRVNKKGQFNVPFGKYKDPKFCDTAGLLRASHALQGAHLEVRGYAEAALAAAEGDFVYFDPPYDPVSPTASFTSYTKDAFGWQQQEELAELCATLNRRGVRFLLSNSATPRIRALYRNFEQRIVRAPRAINSKADARGMVDEILVFNR